MEDMLRVLVLPNLIVVLLVITAGLFLFNAAAGDSAIFDETAHIVAGYSYLRHLDYRFNPEHPPLVKMLAGLPLLFQNLNFSMEKGYWNGLNEQWWAGNEFLYKSGNNADQIIFWARVGPILLALITIIFIYFWSRELIGRWWALLPAFLFAFSPIALAHGHYVTTDVGATLGILLAIRYFLNFLFDQSRKNLIAAGLAFGFLQAVKFSGALLIPHLFLLATTFYFIQNSRAFYKYIFNTLLVIVIGYLAIVYPLYFLTTWNYPVEKQLADTQAILQNFGFRPLADLNLWLASNKILRPLGEYLLGVLMVLQRAAGGNNAYFLGELSAQGWWYYFPVVYLMKEPLPTFLMLFIAALLALGRMIKNLTDGPKRIYEKLREYLQTNFSEFAFLLFIVIYWISSISSPLNIGVRHLLPALPFFYILAAESIKKWFAFEPPLFAITFSEKAIAFFNNLLNFWVKIFIASGLLIWFFLETALASPYFLSYFNNLSGWRENGFYYITDSNFDWGQDLKRLQSWVSENLEPNEKIAVDYFGGGDPAYYLGGQFVPWWSAKGNPKDEEIRWLAISVNTLQGALAKPTAGFYKNPAEEYRWLENPYGFIDRAGTSIFIYKINQ